MAMANRFALIKQKEINKTLADHRKLNITPLSATEFKALWNACDIAPNKVEGFGMSFIDAAFHGIATVGTNSGGIQDAIIDGKTGLIAKTSDINDITKKIDELLSNKFKRNKLGKEGKKNAYEKFIWSRKIIEYLNLL